MASPYEYGMTAEGERGAFGLLGNMFTPFRYPVETPAETTYMEADGALYPQYKSATYGEPEFGFEYMPAYRAISGLLSDPKVAVDAAAAMPEAMRQMYNDQVLAGMDIAYGGSGELVDEDGRRISSDATTIAAPLAPAGIAAAKAGGATLGAMGGSIDDMILAQQIKKRTGSRTMPQAEADLYRAAAAMQLPRDVGEGLLLPQRAYEFGARTGQAADQGLLIDPGFQNLQRAVPDATQQGMSTIVDLNTLAKKPTVDIQSLIGRTAKLMPGDMTMAGKEITHVMGVKLKNPVRMQGGMDFPAEEVARQLGIVWASSPSVIAGYAKQARDNPGLIGIYSAMGGRSNDFSHHVADVLVDMTKQSKHIPEEKIADFNNKIRNTVVTKTDPVTEVKTSSKPFVDFPGITSPKIEKYLYAEGKGAARKAIADVMEKDGFRKVGFPDVSAVRAIVSEPSMSNRVNDPSGMLSPTGGRIVEFDSDPVLPMSGQGNTPSFHKTYGQGIGGTDLGGLGIPVPRILLTPEFFQARRAEGKEPSSDRRSAEISNVLTRITPQKADDVSNYMEYYNRGLLGRGF
tara:strand:+ start:2178 stop:3893 length:1716 start_codon:yes stop_codon:yes gene_type:complete